MAVLFLCLDALSEKVARFERQIGRDPQNVPDAVCDLHRLALFVFDDVCSEHGVPKHGGDDLERVAPHKAVRCSTVATPFS